MPPKGPFPRNYRITFTLHLSERERQRGISREIVEDTIRTGSEKPKPGKSGRGGIHVEFTKVHGKNTVVVIGEVIGDECFAITTYAR